MDINSKIIIKIISSIFVIVFLMFAFYDIKKFLELMSVNYILTSMFAISFMGCFYIATYNER
ncbi:MAG: hypothetical protein ACOCRK_05380 [bacterium]